MIVAFCLSTIAVTLCPIPVGSSGARYQGIMSRVLVPPFFLYLSSASLIRSTNAIIPPMRFSSHSVLVKLPATTKLPSLSSSMSMPIAATTSPLRGLPARRLLISCMCSGNVLPSLVFTCLYAPPLFACSIIAVAAFTSIVVKESDDADLHGPSNPCSFVAHVSICPELWPLSPPVGNSPTVVSSQSLSESTIDLSCSSMPAACRAISLAAFTSLALIFPLSSRLLCSLLGYHSGARALRPSLFMPFGIPILLRHLLQRLHFSLALLRRLF